jgi:rieske iron-sulfur protein
MEFNQERRNLLKSTCAVAGATAVLSMSGSPSAFAFDSQKNVPQIGDSFVFADGAKKGQAVTVADIVTDAPPVIVKAKSASGVVSDEDNTTVLLYRVSPDKIPASTKGDTVEGILAYSAVCTHLGCILTNWNATTKEFLCPCHDALFDPLKEGANTGGATCRSLPHIPVKAVNGQLVVADVPSGHVGVKRG